MVGVELAHFYVGSLEVLNEHLELLLINILELFCSKLSSANRDIEIPCSSARLLTHPLELNVHDVLMLDVNDWFLDENQRRLQRIQESF